MPALVSRERRDYQAGMIVQRQAVRAILLTPQQETLLIRIHDPHVTGGSSWWITPGGGLDPGEDPVSGLRRELSEELGITGYGVGPIVWRRQHTFNWGGRRVCQREDIRIVELERFEPRMTDAVEARAVDEFRWWPLAALARTSEPVTPRSLAAIIARYMAEGAPREPLEVETLVD